MTDDELERWKSERVAALHASHAKMTDAQVRDYLDDIARAIVILAGDVEATEWDADLHLVDVLDKHVGRAVSALQADIEKRKRADFDAMAELEY